MKQWQVGVVMLGLYKESINFVLRAYITNVVCICLQLYKYLEAKIYGENAYSVYFRLQT